METPPSSPRGKDKKGYVTSSGGSHASKRTAVAGNTRRQRRAISCDQGDEASYGVEEESESSAEIHQGFTDYSERPASTDVEGEIASSFESANIDDAIDLTDDEDEQEEEEETDSDSQVGRPMANLDI